MTTDSRMVWKPHVRQLRATSIRVYSAVAVADPLSFLREHVGAENAIVVIEAIECVSAVLLKDATLDTATMLHAQGFSASRKAQARIARTATGWIGDAVHECDCGVPGALQVVATDERMMCLGERLDTNTGASRYGEARITPYTLPLPNGTSQVDAQFRNYYQETASGRLACIAHRVTALVAREET